MDELISGDRLGLSATDEVILVFLLPSDRPYLRIAANAKDPVKGEILFHGTRDKAQELIPSFTAMQGFAIARVPRTARINLDVWVDTDHLQFLGIAADPKDGGLKVEIRVNAYHALNPNQAAMRAVDLMITPVINPPEHKGLVAFDLGNTSSTLARMPVVDLEGSSPVQWIKIVRIAHPSATQARRAVDESVGPVPTQLRLTAFSAAPTKGDFPQYECRIPSSGEARDTDQSSCELLGIKRLVSDPSGEDLKVFLGGQVIDLPKSDPAELYSSEMFLGFFRDQQSYPNDLIITCPTTFSRAEVEALKLAVYQGWRRARGAREQHVSDENRGKFDEGFRRLLGDTKVIDEASAAAFYFLFKDFVTAPGRVPAMRYIYPEGLRLLLYDCGGGTTDITLIHASFPKGNDVLQIEVLGRAGHRNFGGDSITVAFYKLLKAKLAATVNESAVEFPENPSGLVDYFKDPERIQAIDRIVPTIFNDRTDDLNDFAGRELRRATLFLWDWAEACKKSLAIASDNEVPALPPPPDQSSVDWFAKRIRNGRGGELSGSDLLNRAKTISIGHEEVNALIDADIRLSIGYANLLIEARRTPTGSMDGHAPATDGSVRGPGYPPDIDAVYVVGNASRYPRIRELMLDPVSGLKVHFLKDRLADVPKSELKDSVARGAVLALSVGKVDYGVTVRFDQEFMNRIPFAVTRQDFGRETNPELYSENTAYKALTDRKIKMTPDLKRAIENHNRTLTLYRKWPGDKTEEPFLQFSLERVPDDELIIWFDNSETRQFCVRDPRRKGEKIPGQLITQPLYRAPPQVGNL